VSSEGSQKRFMVFKIALRKTCSCLSREQSDTVTLQQNETKYFSFSKVNFDVTVMSSFYVATAIINGESDKLWQLVLLDLHILITLILHICRIISDFFFFLFFFLWFMLLTLKSLKICGINYYKMSMISRI
jgi:hypothetical protein